MEKVVKASLVGQVGGNHYKDMKIQPVEFIVTNNIPYREANAIKYICRHKNKNGREDIIKAIHYLEMILEDYDFPEIEDDYTDLDCIRGCFEGDIMLDSPIESVIFRYTV